MQLAPGTEVNERIVLREQLQGGVMGSVWTAYHSGLDIEVVVKFLGRVRGKDREQAIARFTVEARAASQINSPHVVRIFDFGVMPSGMPFMVMERLAGESLEARLKKVGWLSIEDAVPIIEQTARALDAAHALDVVHRDIKPANIFLTEAHGELVVKVVDFGMAKRKLRGEGRGITDPGLIVGTPAYLSREVLASGSHVADAQVDLWALGVVAYRMVVGALPFRGDSVTDVCRAIVAGNFEPASRVNPALEPDVDAWFARAFDPTLSLRFSDAAELAATFRGLSTGPPTAKPRTQRPSRRAPWPLLAILLAGALGVVAWHQDWIGPREPAASPSTPGPSESSSAPFASTAPASAPSVDEPIASADPADARAELDEVLVPGGDVWVGCHAGDPGCSASADAEVRVQPFFITRHEVRVIDYGRCVVAKACNGKNLQLAGDSAHPEIASAQCNWNQPGHESQPMTCVSYTQAESYCRWSDARMPTEAEWIRAARGDDRRRFPWGDEAASCERTVMRDDAGRACGGDGSWNVETKREDVSPYAVLDLGGNVREWVSNWFDADRSRTVGSERVVKGGSWADDVDELRIGARRGLRPTERSIRVGFRCARPAVR